MKMRNFIAEQRKLRARRADLAIREAFCCEVREPSIKMLKTRYAAQIKKCGVEELLLLSIESQWLARERELEK